jgi:amino acid transporter
LGFLLGDIKPWQMNTINIGLTALLFFLLYRKIDSVGKITVWLWVGTMITVLAVILSGVSHFDAKVAFNFPPGAFNFSLGFLSGLGAATSIGVYDYLGYYDVCYIGEEVRNPGKVIPRSIILSLIIVAVIYLSMNFAIIGVVPWKSFVSDPDVAIGSMFMQKIWGTKIAQIFTFLILWTAFGSIFTLGLGYSRVPYAAARDGGFFRVFAKLHPTKDFPHVSLTLIILLSIAFSFFDLGMLISALVALRIIVQFIGQIGAVVLLRRYKPDMPRPFRIWLYPLPALAALLGWYFLFLTTPTNQQWIATGALALGLAAFLVWSKITKAWPFKPRDGQTPASP